MPDLAVEYTLVTPAGTVVFNDNAVDQFYITNIPEGMSGAPLRTPMDPVAFGDGGNSYNFWKGARHIIFEGIFLVTSTPPCDAMVAIWNQMEDDLETALSSIAALDTDTGTLTWTPTGLAARSLTVRHDVPLDVQPDQNYAVRTFTFGLVADDPDW